MDFFVPKTNGQVWFWCTKGWPKPHWVLCPSSIFQGLFSGSPIVTRYSMRNWRLTFSVGGILITAWPRDAPYEKSVASRGELERKENFYFCDRICREWRCICFSAISQLTYVFEWCMNETWSLTYVGNWPKHGIRGKGICYRTYYRHHGPSFPQ